VAAWLLREQGHEVVGVFMRNWHDESVTLSSDCPWREDSTDALMVADRLGIPFHTLDFSEVYRRRIVDYMFAEYKAGRTPNPDVLCNREIKFDVFLDAARKLGAGYVATGHYCRREVTEKDGRPVYRLLAGADANKDQSYFLCQLDQAQLSRALFPIGHLHKHQVRNIARELGLVTAEKKDSQGLCFVGKVHLPDFLQQRLKAKRGDILMADRETASAAMPKLPPQETWALLPDPLLEELCSPPVYHAAQCPKLGEHQGAHFFTIGQRKGLNVGGLQRPLFVLATDTGSNLIFAGMGEDHPGLYRQGLFVEASAVHWIRDDLQLKPGEAIRLMVRIRHRQPLSPAMLIMREQGMYVLFGEPQRGIAPGQFVAWYQGDECIGSGVIDA